MANPGHKARLDVTVDGVTKTVSGRPGYVGFDYGDTLSSRPTPGAGAIGHQLTDNDEGTFGFTVDDDAEMRALLWNAMGKTIEMQYTPPSPGTAVSLSGIADVSAALQANDSVRYAVTGPLTARPT